uniref:TSA: Wollemia nobilis Ref_Wollemi_Transcript_13305_876 transcribed RNA sequence n=1 Tax=Wollemia nobilis TaxID=56998 RepID=A0A0C9RKR8_9CONI
MAEGNVIACHSTDAWKSKLEEAKSSGKLVVVDFTAAWCGPCRIISPVYVELSKTYKDVVFLKVDVDELQDVTEEWEVQSMPTFIFIKDGKPIDKIIGARKDELERKVAALASA